MLKIDNETAEQAILRVLAEAGSIQPLTLYRILAPSRGEHSPRQLAKALVGLSRDGLIDQYPGAHGHYWLTERGRAAANAANEPRSLKEIVVHPGKEALDIQTGKLAIGTDINGVARHWQLWDSSGTLPFLVSGASGSGGTETLAGLIEATVPHHPDVRVWLIDNYHELFGYRNQVEKVAVNTIDDLEEPGIISTTEMLDQVLDVVTKRNRLLAHRGSKGWAGPFDEARLPLGILIIGRIDTVASDWQLRWRLNQISKMARKAGILIASHSPSLRMEPFGGDMALQDYFAAGNVLALRHSTPLFGRMVPSGMADLEPIPRTFDDGSITAGVGHMADGTQIRTYLTTGL